MGGKKVVDLSHFLLFEEAGDSGADVDANMVSFAMVDDQGNRGLAEKGYEDDGDDDDDAESSCYDVGFYGSSRFRDAQSEILGKGGETHLTHRHGDGDDDVDKHKGDHGDVDDDGDGFRVWEMNKRDEIDHHHHHHMRAFEGEEEKEMVSEVTSTANSYSSRKCVRSSERKMTEEERNRLFWEACLTS